MKYGLENGAAMIDFRVNTEAHTSFDRPDDAALLWRYFDMEKYVSLLATRSLWLSRSDLLGDRFEGSLGLANREMRKELYGDEIPAEAMDQIVRHRAEQPLRTFINCWHQNPGESSAMWALYASRAGIAIVSDYDRIRTAVGETSASCAGVVSIYVSRVKYADYNSIFIPEDNLFTPFVHKRRSYEHEAEVRLIAAGFAASDTAQLGWAVPVDLSELIGEVRVSPNAPAWFLDAVAETTERFGLTVSVTKSDLGGDPIY